MKFDQSPSLISGSSFGKSCPDRTVSSNATSSSYTSARQNSLSGGGSASAFMFESSIPTIVSLHISDDTADGKGRFTAPQAEIALDQPPRLLRASEQAATTHGAAAREPAGPHASSSPTRAGWRRLVSAILKLEDSPAGDWIGGAAIALLLIAGLWIGAGFGWTEVLP